VSRPPAPVDLARVRGALDRLAELYREGVDVPGLLAELEDEPVNDEATLPAAVSLRLPPSLVAAADALVEPLADRSEALAAGGNWGRSAVLRLALARGLAELAREVEIRAKAEAKAEAKGRTDGR
jgi:hypothetical protein